MTETLSIPKSTYLNQAARAARHDPEATLSARLGGRARRAEEEFVVRKSAWGQVVVLRRQAVRAARQRLARRGRHPRLPRRRAEPARRHRRRRVRAQRPQGVPIAGDRLPRRVAGVLEAVSAPRQGARDRHALRPRHEGGPDRGAPLVAHANGGSVYMTDDRRGRAGWDTWHTRVRLLRGSRLDRGRVRGVRRRAGRIHGVVPLQEAREVAWVGALGQRHEEPRTRSVAVSPEKRPRPRAH